MNGSTTKKCAKRVGQVLAWSFHQEMLLWKMHHLPINRKSHSDSQCLNIKKRSLISSLEKMLKLHLHPGASEYKSWWNFYVKQTFRRLRLKYFWHNVLKTIEKSCKKLFERSEHKKIKLRFWMEQTLGNQNILYLFTIISRGLKINWALFAAACIRIRLIFEYTQLYSFKIIG